MVRKLERKGNEMKKILFVASECVPFIKTGGLADVVGSLPKCFDKKEYDVRVIIPKYACMADKYTKNLRYITNFHIQMNTGSQYVGLFETEYDGIKIYFIDSEYYFGGMTPYGDMGYDIPKFAFFSKAVLSSLPVLDFRPDILHCHDWQTGLIPVLLKDIYYGSEFYRGIKTIMTIHNLKFQGVWNIDYVRELSGLMPYHFTSDKLEAYGDANFLKGGIVYADKVTTVSETYANEIKESFYGEGLDGVLRSRDNDLIGICNGIDYDEYNPSTDKYLKYKFDSDEHLKNVFLSHFLTIYEYFQYSNKADVPSIFGNHFLHSSVSGNMINKIVPIIIAQITNTNHAKIESKQELSSDSFIVKPH